MTFTTWQLVAAGFFVFCSGVGVLVIAAWAFWLIDKIKERIVFRAAEKKQNDLRSI